MTWTRLDDNWTDRPDLAELSYADRWHLLALIQLCSRTGRYDGRLRLIDARRASDHPDPDAAHAALAAAGLVTRTDHAVHVLDVADHVPPPSVRVKSTERTFTPGVRFIPSDESEPR